MKITFWNQSEGLSEVELKLETENYVIHAEADVTVLESKGDNYEYRVSLGYDTLDNEGDNIAHEITEEELNFINTTIQEKFEWS